MRMLLTVLIALLVCVTPAPAQQGQHMTITNDALKWVEPPTFPGAKLAIVQGDPGKEGDRKSTRLNSSHLGISYAVFCLKKKKKIFVLSNVLRYENILD